LATWAFWLTAFSWWEDRPAVLGSAAAISNIAEYSRTVGGPGPPNPLRPANPSRRLTPLRLLARLLFLCTCESSRGKERYLEWQDHAHWVFHFRISKNMLMTRF